MQQDIVIHIMILDHFVFGVKLLMYMTPISWDKLLCSLSFGLPKGLEFGTACFIPVSPTNL